MQKFDAENFGFCAVSTCVCEFKQKFFYHKTAQVRLLHSNFPFVSWNFPKLFWSHNDENVNQFKIWYWTKRKTGIIELNSEILLILTGDVVRSLCWLTSHHASSSSAVAKSFYGKSFIRWKNKRRESHLYTMILQSSDVSNRGDPLYGMLWHVGIHPK